MTAVLHQFPDSADMVMFMIGPGLYSRVMRPRLVTTLLSTWPGCWCLLPSSELHCRYNIDVSPHPPSS